MPAASAACRMVEPLATSTSIPSMVSLAMSLLLRRHTRRRGRAGLVGGHPFFHQRPEMPDQTLDRPGRSIAQRTDRVALHLPGHLLQRIDLGRFGSALDHAGHDPPHPAGAFAARRTLATTLMHIEFRQPRDG